MVTSPVVARADKGGERETTVPHSHKTSAKRTLAVFALIATSPFSCATAGASTKHEGRQGFPLAHWTVKF